MPKHRNRQRLKKASGEGVWGKLADAYVRWKDDTVKGASVPMYKKRKKR